MPSKVDRSAHAVFVFVERYTCVQTGVQTVTSMRAPLGGKQRYVTDLREKLVLKIWWLQAKLMYKQLRNMMENNSGNWVFLHTTENNDRAHRRWCDGTLSENLAVKHDDLSAKHDDLRKNMHAAQEVFVNTGVNVDGVDLRCEARFCERPSITTRKMMR